MEVPASSRHAHLRVGAVPHRIRYRDLHVVGGVRKERAPDDLPLRVRRGAEGGVGSSRGLHEDLDGDGVVRQRREGTGRRDGHVGVVLVLLPRIVAPVAVEGGYGGIRVVTDGDGLRFRRASSPAVGHRAGDGQRSCRGYLVAREHRRAAPCGHRALDCDRIGRSGSPRRVGDLARVKDRLHFGVSFHVTGIREVFRPRAGVVRRQRHESCGEHRLHAAVRRDCEGAAVVHPCDDRAFRIRVGGQYCRDRYGCNA